MAKKLYTNSKIIIPDPYVIRIEHDFDVDDLLAFRAFPKLARERVFGTWGHTNPIVETVQTKKSPPIDPNNKLQVLAALFNSDTEFRTRSYWFFEDKMDATAFRLSTGEKALHVFMWPRTLKFTVYEM